MGTVINKWLQEFQALPEWVQKIFNGLYGWCLESYSVNKDDCLGCSERHNGCSSGRISLVYPRDKYLEAGEALGELREFMDALSAPTEHKEVVQIKSINVVELGAEDDEEAWDTPCRYGHHIIGHAVYCHSPWPNRPRKCRRKWRGKEYRFEDCPSFAINHKGVDYGIE